MKLPSLELPDDPQQWPAWLEGQLLGPDLGDLVQQLKRILDSTDDGPSLPDICGERLPDVCADGLTALTSDQIRSLLRYPKRLLDLQERILVEGGDFWSRYLDTAETRSRTAEYWTQLQPQLMSSPAAVARAECADQVSPITTPRRIDSDRRRWLGLVIGMLAGGVLIGLGIRLQWPKSDAWGWNRPGVLTANVTGPESLRRLATAAEEWFKRPRDTTASLEQQLADFRRGCDALLSAPLTQLSATDRDWLKERCRVWASKFDGQLATLRNDPKSLGAVCTEADQTVRALISAIEQRAKQA